MGRRHALLASVFCAVALSGCDLPEINTEQQWGDAMRRLSLYGIYPSHEDVQLGDVFLRVPPTDADGRARFSVARIGPAFRASLRDALCEESAGRLRIAPWSDAATFAAADARGVGRGVAPPTGSARVSDECAGSPAAPRERFRVGSSLSDVEGPRLNRTAIPALTAARLTEGQLSGMVPLQWVSAQLGIGVSRQVALSINIRGAEMLGVEAGRMQRHLQRDLPKWIADHLPPARLIRLVGNMNRETAARLCRGDADAEAYMFIANQVLYTHSIQYEFSRQSQVATRVVADLSRLFPISGQSAPSPTVGTGTGSLVTINNGTPPERLPSDAVARDARDATSLERVRLAQRAQLSAISEALAGTSFNRAGVVSALGVGTTGGLALTDQFERPMAVGLGAAQYIDLSGALMAFSTEADHERRSRQLNARIAEAVMTCAAYATPDRQSRNAQALRVGPDESGWFARRSDGLSSLDGDLDLLRNRICENSRRQVVIQRLGRLAGTGDAGDIGPNHEGLFEPLAPNDPGERVIAACRLASPATPRSFIRQSAPLPPPGTPAMTIR